MAVLSNKRQVIVQNEDDVSSENESIEEESEEESQENGNETDSNKESENDEDDEENVNAGWADSIAKILKSNKPKGKKTLVLSKAKKLTDAHREKPKPAGFQVEKVDGEIKDEEIELGKTIEKTDEPKRKRKKEILSARLKPNILEKDRERLLMKIATKGVVQLFNAVKTQQKDIKTKLQEAGPLEVRKEKVLRNIDKRAFLDVLMGEKSQTISDGQEQSQTNTSLKKEHVDNATWSVLRDDFMMGAKMKDWDKELDEDEEEMEVENNIESD